MNMRSISLLALSALFAFSACGASGGAVGDECESDDDCAEGLECHLHEHDGEVSDHGECEEAGEHEDDHDDDHEDDTDDHSDDHEDDTDEHTDDEHTDE